MFLNDIHAVTQNTEPNSILLPDGLTYSQKILSRYSASLYQLLPFQDTSGLVATDIGPNGFAATYSGATLANAIGPDGKMVCTLDGVNDYIDLLVGAFGAGFPGAAGTWAIWAKVSGAGIWTDGLFHSLLEVRGNTATPAHNIVQIIKLNTNNAVDYYYRAANTLEQVSLTSFSSTAWIHFALTWSKLNEEVKAYVNGVQTGLTQNALGIWSATDLTVAHIGRQAPASFYWSGPVAYSAIWSIAQPANVIADLATI